MERIMMKAKILGLLAAGLVAGSPVTLASTTLVGTPVTIQYFDDIGAVPDPDPETVTVQEFGAEVVCGVTSSAFCGQGILGPGEFIDVGPSSIALNLSSTQPFGNPARFDFGLLFTGTSTTIVGVEVTISELFNDALTKGDVTYTPNGVSLNMSGVALEGDGNGEIFIELLTRTAPLEPIPEPSTVALLGGGLLGLFALRRRTAARAA
jgi:hypothetical protein